MTKQDYHSLKKYLKVLSKPQIKELCNEVELNAYEIHLFISWYDGDSVVKIAMDNFISDRNYTKQIKKVFNKIYNYFLYKNISY